MSKILPFGWLEPEEAKMQKQQANKPTSAKNAQKDATAQVPNSSMSEKILLSKIFTDLFSFGTYLW